MDDPTAALMPMMTLTVGEGELKPSTSTSSDQGSSGSGKSSVMLHSPGDVEYPGYGNGGCGSGGDPDSDLDSDPNRFNAYLNRGSELWTHWSWLGGQGKMSLMRCNYCQVNKQLKNAPKCRRHLIKCPKTPEPVRRYFEKKEVEATRVSALMRELRSKEIKFPRNSVPPAATQTSEQHASSSSKVSSDNHNHSSNKVPVPTANDLKHLQLKHQSTSLSSVIVNKQHQQSNGHGHGHGSSGSTGSASPADMSLSGGSPKYSSVSIKSENHRHHLQDNHHHQLQHQQHNHNHHQQLNSLDIKPVVSSPLMLNGKSAKHDNVNGGNHAAVLAAALRNGGTNDNNNAFLNDPSLLSLYYQQILCNMQQQQTNGNTVGGSDNANSIDLSSKSNHHSSGKRSASQRDLDTYHLNLLQNGNGNHTSHHHTSSSSGKLKKVKRESLLTPSPAHHNQLQHSHQNSHHRDALSLIGHQLKNGNGGSGGMSITNKENAAVPTQTVVINLDDMSSFDASDFFNSGLLGGNGGQSGFHHQMPQLLPPPLTNGGGGGGGARKKRPRESVIQSSNNNNNGFSSGNNSNGRHHHLHHHSDTTTNGNGSGMHHSHMLNKALNGGGGSNGHNGSGSISNGNAITVAAADFARFNPAELEVVHDDLNDLLASALISAGVDFEFVGNPFFAKYISQLVALSGSNANSSSYQYRLPSSDKLLTSNLTNLVRKFDHETAKIFADADSIVVSLDWSSNRSVIVKQQQLQQSFDVNLLISSSNAFSQLFYKTIPAQLGGDHRDVDEGQRTAAAAAMLTQISSLIEKVGAQSINAMVLPLDQDQGINNGHSASSSPSAASIITAFLATAHSHIVPLSNSYQLFHRLLCDICRIPAIHKLLGQCIGLFKELTTPTTSDGGDGQSNSSFAEFQEESEKHWKRVFESDSLKIYLHFLKQAESGGENSSSAYTPPKNHWVSLNLVLCWFLVAKSSIIDLFNKLHKKDDEDSEETEGEEDAKEQSTDSLDSLLAKHDLRADQIERFFTQIHVLFNFLTPFITAVHLIENDSCVISDIVKIYFDVKMTVGADSLGNLFDNSGSSGSGEKGGISADKLERQSLDVILHRYLQEANLSRYLYLAFYLDPRFRSDKRLEENEELISAVYDTLFNYATALGCVVAGEEEDRERLVDALEEFRNGEKLYGTQLLKSPKSPVKYWKHLQRFPASAKLAYCASRLLSISTRAMLIGGGGHQEEGNTSTSSLQRRLLTFDFSATSATGDFDPKVVGEKILPIKSYLKLQLSDSAVTDVKNFDDEEKQLVEGNGSGVTDLSSTATPSTSSSPTSPDSISNIISNVITSLDHYSRSISQPFTSGDLVRLTQTSYSSDCSAASASASSA